MFKLVQCAENTYYLKCYTNTGVYYLGNGEVVLIDSCDHKKSYTDLFNQLEERGWRVKMIINTHAHIDHIVGNRFFKEKYDCKIYSSRTESHLIDISDFEGTLYFNGLPFCRERSYFFRPVGTTAENVENAPLPEGFEILPLPGHTFEMIGVKTPDGVWFTGDAVLAKETFESYKLPFFFGINKSIETAEVVSRLEGEFFVPSHAEGTKDISSLALFNADCLKRLKEYFYSISDEKTLDEIFAEAAKTLSLRLDNDQYGKLLVTVKSFLQSLIDDKRLDARLESFRPVYFHT